MRSGKTESVPGFPRFPVMQAIIGVKALAVMLETARRGYQAKRRHEAMGLLFGRADPDGTVHIKHAVPYRCAKATSSRVEYSTAAVARRREVAERLRTTYFGVFHSHPDENGLEDMGESYEDCQGLYDDPVDRLESIVYVWPRKERPRRKSSTSLYEYDEKSRLAFAVRVFGKVRDGIRRIPVTVKP